MALYRPIERRKLGWYGEHRRQVNRTIKQQAEVIILGDSIAAGLSRYPRVCSHLTKQFNIVNCGISGDCISDVMWRVIHFSIPDSLRCAVIVTGTNNIDVDKPLDIALGLLSCAALMRVNRPHLNVIIPAILPRDLHVTPRRTKIRQTNEIIKSLCLLEPNVSFIEESSRWVDGCDRLNEMLYHTDYLHLIMAGNEIFAGQLAAAISPILDGEPEIKQKRLTRKELPPLSLPDTFANHHTTPPSCPPSQLPIPHPCQPCPISPSPALSTPTPSTPVSSPSHSSSNHSTPTFSSFTRAIGGKFLVNLYIYLFLLLLFFTWGVQAGGVGGCLELSSQFLSVNDTVFIDGIGGRGGIFTGAIYGQNRSFHKTFVFPNTSEYKIQVEF